MGTTADALEDNDHLNLAWVLVFEGVNYAATTAVDAAAIATAWAATEWTTFKSGLFVPGSLSRSIVPFDPKIQTPVLEVDVLDVDDSLLTSMLREADSSIGHTWLTASVGPTGNWLLRDKTNPVAFAASGTAYCGTEAATYSAIGSGADEDPMTVTQRGMWSLFGTSSDSAHFGKPHRVTRDSSGQQAAPAVTAGPKTWVNRRVALYLTHYENGAWATKANALLFFAGRLKRYEDLGNGKIRLSLRSVEEQFKSTVFNEQLSGQVAEGTTPLDIHRAMQIYVGTTGITYEPLVALTGVAGARRTWDDIRDAINSQFSAWKVAGSINARDDWECSLEADDQGNERIVFRMRADTAIAPPDFVDCRLHKWLWWMLGWAGDDDSGDVFYDGNGRQMVRRSLARKNSTTYELRAPHPPLLYAVGSHVGADINVEATSGTWLNQPTVPGEAPGGTQGFLRVGDNIFAGSYSAGVFSVKGLLNVWTRSIETDYVIEDGFFTVRLGEGADVPQVKQVWFERGDAGTLMAKLILSTGTAAYNEATYDIYGAGFGLGLPYTMVNVSSILGIDTPAPVPYDLFLEGPTAFDELLQPLMLLTGRYPVWKGGQFTLIKAGYENPNLPSNWALTESNKSVPDQRTTVVRTVDGVINTVVIQYGGALDGSGKPDSIAVVEDDSRTDIEQTKPLKVDARGLALGRQVIKDLIAPAIAYFKRPLAEITRSFDHTLAAMSPGDGALLTDSAMAHPRDGTRGVTTLACWIVAVTINLRKMAGELVALFLPEMDTRRLAKWGGAARVDSTAANAGYDVATKTLTCEARAFAHSSESVDVAQFAATYKVHVYSVDEASPLEWFDTVASINTSTYTIVLTTGLAGWDTAKKYIIEFDDISTDVADQRAHAFLADDTTLSTGYSTDPAPYVYGEDPTAALLSVTTVDYTKQVTRPFANLDAQGEPLSVSKAWTLADSINALIGYKTSNELLNHYFNTEESQLGVTMKLVLAVWVPFYGHVSLGGVRTVKAKFRGRSSGAGDKVIVKVKGAKTPPRGAAFTTPVYDPIVSSTSLERTGNTNDWSTESEVTVYPAAYSPGFFGFWLMVEVSGNGAFVTGYINQIVVREVELS